MNVPQLIRNNQFRLSIRAHHVFLIDGTDFERFMVGSPKTSRNTKPELIVSKPRKMNYRLKLLSLLDFFAQVVFKILRPN